MRRRIGRSDPCKLERCLREVESAGNGQIRVGQAGLEPSPKSFRLGIDFSAAWEYGFSIDRPREE